MQTGKNITSKQRYLAYLQNRLTNSRIFLLALLQIYLANRYILSTHRRCPVFYPRKEFPLDLVHLSFSLRLLSQEWLAPLGWGYYRWTKFYRLSSDPFWRFRGQFVSQKNICGRQNIWKFSVHVILSIKHSAATTQRPIYVAYDPCTAMTHTNHARWFGFVSFWLFETIKIVLPTGWEI